MNPKRIFAIVLRQLFLIRRNPTRFTNIFIWVALDIVTWGFITRYLNDVGQSGFSFIPVLLGAAIIWNLMIRSQQGVILAFFEDMWSRNFLNLFASPLKIHEYILGLVTTGILTSTIGFTVMVALAGFAFGYNLFSIGAPLVLFLLILSIFGLALGIVTTAFVLRFGPSAEWFAWVVPWVMGPFSGVFYPVAILPESMRFISVLVPPSYVFEGLRGLLIRGEFLPEPLLLGLALATLYLALAYWIFISIFKTVVKSGLLTRFAAES